MIKKSNIFFGFINISIYIFLTEVLTLLLGRLSFIKNIWFLNFYLLLAPIVVTSLLIYINKDLFKDKWTDFKNNKQEYITLIIKYYLCGLIMMIVTNLMIQFFTKDIPQNEANSREILKLMPIYSFISMVFTAPISEELSFRGSFKKAIPRKYLYLTITSLLFGFMHVAFNGDFINMIPYSALGFFLGKLYYETDNILLSTSAHMLHNFICILIIILGGAI